MELAAGAGVAAAAAAGGAAYLRGRGPASGKEGTTKWQWRAAAVKERRALCICCSYPGTQWALPGCVPDQEAMVKTLIRNSYANKRTDSPSAAKRARISETNMPIAQIRTQYGKT